MTFLYKGYTAEGAARAGRVEAADEAAAAKALLAQGVYARSLRPLAAGARSLAASSRAALYRELGALLGAGLPLDRALDLLRAEGGAADGGAALERVAGAVREGRGLAGALALSGAGPGAFERAAIASAEASATLPAMLARLADRLEAEEAARGAVRAALVYPCFVLLLGIAVAAVLLGVVVPSAERALADAGLPLPAASRWLVGAARAVVFGFVPLALLAAAALGAAKLRARGDRAFAERLDALLLRLPGAGFARQRAAQRFAAILGALAEGGMPLPDALPLAAAGTARPSLEAALVEATARVRAGTALADALSPVPHVGPLLAPWARVGEAGGCLPQMLDAASSRLRARWERTLSTRLALLGPVLLAVVGLFVLALALGLVLPLLRVASEI